MNQKIKVGILLTSYELTIADYEMIEKIKNSDSSVLSVIIMYHQHQIIANYKSPFYVFYEAFDKALFKVSKNFSSKKNLQGLFVDIPQITVNSTSQSNSPEDISDDDCLLLKHYGLDIILQAGTFQIAHKLINIAKYGVWVTKLYDSKAIKTGPPLYWDFVNKTGELGSVVQILNEDQEKTTTIYRSWELMNHYSLNINRSRVFGRASLYIPRIINGLYTHGESYLTYLTKRFNKDIEFDTHRNCGYPTSLNALKNLISIFIVILKHLFKKIFYLDYWFLLVKVNDKYQSFSTSFPKFIRVDSPKDRFWADPFIISRNNKYFLFVEEFIIQTKKGHISVLEIDKTGKCLSSKTIIDQPYHMAYPFIFENDGMFYMIPDTSQNKTIELYKCNSFPDKWELVKVLMNNIYAADTTLFYTNNKWWLFTSIDETGNNSGYDSELFLFFAEDFMSTEWKAHPQNPIIADAKNARGAGRIFTYNNQIFRPSQYCRGNYGKGFNLNRIEVLTENEYKEEAYTRVIPEWDTKIKGTHTFNFDGDFTVIDAFTHRSRLWS